MRGFDALRKAKPLRQMQMADLMVQSRIYSGSFAQTMLLGTRREELVDPETKTRSARPSTDELARIEQEMQAIEGNLLVLDEAYNRDVLNLTFACGYLKKLLANAKIVNYLAQKRPDVLAQFQRIVDETLPGR